MAGNEDNTAHVRNHVEGLVVTLTDATGIVLSRHDCVDGHEAAKRACTAIAARDPLRIGDMLRVTVPAPRGEVHQIARETD